MLETRYGLNRSDAGSVPACCGARDRMLKAPGFGVLTTIDVQQTLKSKVDRDFRKYVILGA